MTKRFSRISLAAAAAMLMTGVATAGAAATPSVPAQQARTAQEAGPAGVLADARFGKGTQFCRNQSLTSGNGRAVLRVQQDGNFVLYKDGRAAWQAPGAWPKGNCAIFQQDGNFVLYDVNGKAVWHSNTWNRGHVLAVQDDGNVVVYDQSNRPLWATNTGD
ncbi:hypothetical protein RND61_25675 [Streptomyces sp. TRM76323]|uniref:Bulb-type lectin domain-containing protein n=1 Tax=Streptomyces tamarix TaxID=3078565 RepID=A0ABU3QRR4_9ACTN|nr:hypothetical protein [Streptomyces tamarix]MDT9685428.1 hypothetical protein [Streptomyces tamarix]